MIYLYIYIYIYIYIYSWLSWLTRISTCVDDYIELVRHQLVFGGQPTYQCGYEDLIAIVIV